MDNNVTIFKNEEFGEIRTIVIDGEPWFVGKDMAQALGYSNSSKAVSTHVDKEDKQFIMIDIADSQNGNVPMGQSKTAIINESGMYSLILGSKLEKARSFKRWVTSEVLPTIRKTGGYVYDDDSFINTYLPFADETTRLLFSTTLQTVRNQNEIIKNQKKELSLKQEVINGLTADIPIYEKPDIINRICKKACGGYANRYKELYKCFKENYHIDLPIRCDNYNEKQEKSKDKLSVIRYAEKFGFIEDLFSCCAKLYESDIDKVIEEMRNAQEGID